MTDVMTDKVTDKEKRPRYVSVGLQGETARRLQELQDRGLVSSAKDAVIQGINLLYERFLEMDLKVREATRLEP